MWGKRFLLAWKYFTLNAENENEKWKTCGYYDQCPFGVAMLQVAQDYHCMRHEQQQQQPSTSTSKLEWEQNWLQSRHYNTTLEELAFRSGANIQNTLFRDELARLTSSQSNKHWKDANIPVQIGPILLIPTWEGGLRLPSTTTPLASISQDGYDANNKDDSSNSHKYDLAPSSLMNEPSSLFENIHNESPWPFAIHAKYSNLFCHRNAKYFFDFELKYKAIHREQCTATELSSMWNESASCWAKWQKSVRSTN
jgi:hypothetical protein